MAKKAKGKQKQDEKPQSSNPVSPVPEPVRAVVEPEIIPHPIREETQPATWGTPVEPWSSTTNDNGRWEQQEGEVWGTGTGMQGGGGWGQEESLLEPPANHGPSVLPTIYEQPSSSTVHHLDQNRASAMSVDTYSEAFSDQDPQHWENPQTRNLTAAPSATGSPIPRQQHISIAEAAEAAARQQDRVSLTSEARLNQEETRVPLNDYSAGLQSFMASPAPQNSSLRGLPQRDPNAPKKISTASAFAAQYEASTKRNRPQSTQPTKSPQQPTTPAKPGKVTWRDDQPLFEGARPPAPIPSDTTWVTSGGNAWSNRHRSAPDGSFINHAQPNNEAWHAELQHYRAAEQLSQKEYAARQARAMQQSHHSKHHSFPATHPMMQQQQQQQKRPSAQQNQSWQGWGRPEGDGESESEEGTVTGHGWGQQDQWGTMHKGGISQGKRNERNGHVGAGWGQTSNDAWGTSGWGQDGGGARGKENPGAWGQGDSAWGKETTDAWGQEGDGTWGKENAGAWGQAGDGAWGQEIGGAWGQTTGVSGGAWGQEVRGNDAWGQQVQKQSQKHTSKQPQHAGQQGDRRGQHPHSHQMQNGHQQMQGQQGHRVPGHVQNHHQGHSRHVHSQHGHPAMWDGDEEESEDQWGEEDETEDEDDGWGASGGQDDWGVNGHHQPKVTFKVGSKNDISAHDRSQILNSLLKQTQSQHNAVTHGNAQQHAAALAAAHAKKAQQQHYQHKDLGHWEVTADKGWGSIADEGEYEGNRRVHFSPKTSEIWGGSPRPVPSKTLTQARQGLATTLINDASDVRFVDSRGAAFDYVSNAFFGNSRFARERIHWLFPPNKDPRVEGMLAWVQKMSFNLGTYGLTKFIERKERGALFINTLFRLQNHPAEPAVDYLTFNDLQGTMDKTLQESVAFYDPGQLVIVFVYLPSQTGNSIAIWRRKVHVPDRARLKYRNELAAITKTLRENEQYVVMVDELPKNQKKLPEKAGQLHKSPQVKVKANAMVLPQPNAEKRRKWWKLFLSS